MCYAISHIVNFLGPRDEFVVSGSDDGNVFIWDKLTGKLCDILQGDNHVVNVIEGHPYLPLIAVSGIDTTVKVSEDAMREAYTSTDQLVLLSYLHPPMDPASSRE